MFKTNVSGTKKKDNVNCSDLLSTARINEAMTLLSLNRRSLACLLWWDVYTNQFQNIQYNQFFDFCAVCTFSFLL